MTETQLSEILTLGISGICINLRKVKPNLTLLIWEFFLTTLQNK
jgi:hypothetical protein